MAVCPSLINQLTCVYTHVYVYIRAYAHHLGICMYIQPYTCIFMPVCMYMHVYTAVYMYMKNLLANINRKGTKLWFETELCLIHVPVLGVLSPGSLL